MPATLPTGQSRYVISLDQLPWDKKLTGKSDGINKLKPRYT